MASPKLRIIPLGGVDEIGKNMTAFEYEDDILVVDCGSIFPKEDMLGIDLVIPDASYLVANKTGCAAMCSPMATRTISAPRLIFFSRCPPPFTAPG